MQELLYKFVSAVRNIRQRIGDSMSSISKRINQFLTWLFMKGRPVRKGFAVGLALAFAVAAVVGFMPVRADESLEPLPAFATPTSAPAVGDTLTAPLPVNVGLEPLPDSSYQAPDTGLAPLPGGDQASAAPASDGDAYPQKAQMQGPECNSRYGHGRNTACTAATPRRGLQRARRCAQRPS